MTSWVVCLFLKRKEVVCEGFGLGISKKKHYYVGSGGRHGKYERFFRGGH